MKMLDFYHKDDFIKAPKMDAHMHYNVFDDTYIKYATDINVKLMMVNVDIGFSIEEQLNISRTLKKKYPSQFYFIGTFDPSGFNDMDFTEKTIRQINRCMKSGAQGIKIWKNIGMSIKDEQGNYVMANHPAFMPIYAYLENNKIPMLVHLGEPRNCWLPYDQITMRSELNYYRGYPEYHMHLHPEAPSYEEQIAVRDDILGKFPKLDLIGAHLGSLEWNVDEVAERFDQYPHFTIDISGRMGHIHLQAVKNHGKVYDFFMKYQDRIMYGSDLTFSLLGLRSKFYHIFAHKRFTRKNFSSFFTVWHDDWLFFATGSEIPVEETTLAGMPEKIKGLKLPKEVVDKIFYINACNIYHLEN
ncbi:MAG: amidohydrolase [Bacteroidales bacterium]|jgi:predicted TIM-barrel fold metal-dependent hydrolase|nr:amidohydrolase [Bacteroidales bacterium]